MSDTPQRIPRKMFDDLARQKQFADGPYISEFGNGEHDPYMPQSKRRVKGTLKDGRHVYAESDDDGFDLIYPEIATLRQELANCHSVCRGLAESEQEITTLREQLAEARELIPVAFAEGRHAGTDQRTPTDELWRASYSKRTLDGGFVRTPDKAVDRAIAGEGE